jgi:polar amino acid transport system substrate-binding protein
MSLFQLFRSPLPELKPTLGKFLSLMAILMGLAWISVSGCMGQRSLDYKVFRIGRDASWYPLQLMGKEKNMVAFTNEMLLAIAKEEGFHFEILDVRSHTLFEDLERGSYDAVFSALIPNVLNREKYEFSQPFFSVGPVLVVPKSSPVNSLVEMEGKIIGVQRGSSLVFTISQYPSLLFAPFDQISTALESMFDNKIDGVIMDLMTAYSHGYYTSQLKVITPPLTDEGLRLVAKHGVASTYLLTRFNQGLKKIEADGTYQKLLVKWGLTNPNNEP